MPLGAPHLPTAHELRWLFQTVGSATGGGTREKGRALARKWEEQPGEADCGQHKQSETQGHSPETSCHVPLADCSKRDGQQQRENRHGRQVAQLHGLILRWAAVSNASMTASTFMIPAAAIKRVP